MRSVLGRWFGWVVLAVLAVLAYLGARVVNNLVAEGLTLAGAGPAATLKGVPGGPERPEGNPVATGDPYAWASAVLARNLFDSAPVAAAPTPGSDATSAGPPPGEHDPTCAPEAALGLLATLVALPRDASMALVRDPAGASERLVHEGQALGDSTVAAIYRGRVVLSRGGRYTCLAMGEPPASAPARSLPSDAGASDSISLEGGTRVVPRTLIEGALEDPATLTRDGRAIAHFRDGRPDGFKLVGVRAGSLYTQLGLRSGDVLRAVNDEPLTGVKAALGLYERLGRGGAVHLEVERRGRRLSLAYEIR